MGRCLIGLDGQRLPEFLERLLSWSLLVIDHAYVVMRLVDIRRDGQRLTATTARMRQRATICHGLWVAGTAFMAGAWGGR